ncbi:MAG: hypothetical protein ACRDQ4_00005, partial [Pseudonocardiaceae bacterium]
SEERGLGHAPRFSVTRDGGAHAEVFHVLAHDKREQGALPGQGTSDEQLDNTHLMRMAGRFARRVRASARAHGIPVIDCNRGERKHQIAEEYLASHAVGPGVFLILVARASAPVWEVVRSASGVIVNLAKKRSSSTITRFTSWIRSGVM